MFSRFDDHNKTIFDIFYLVWFLMFLLSLVLVENRYHLVSSWKTSKLFVYLLSFTLLKNTKLFNINGRNAIFASLFTFLFIVNMQGLLPYTFSLSSHLAIVLPMALPLWLSFLLMRSSYRFRTFLAHFLPAGSPSLLSPFLCIIELVSIIIRPMTLSVRVVANLSTGHILIGLLASGWVGSMGFSSFLLLFIGSLYLMFEMAVCLVQAYIFTLLPSLYGDEHSV